MFGPVFGLENLAKNSTACTAQGVAIQYFGSVVIWWFFAIALDLYLIVVHKKDHLQSTLEKVLHALCWGVPAIQTIVPLIFHKFEDRLVWCWISQSDSGLWELSFFYAVMGILGIATGYFWLHVVFKIRRVSLMASLTGKTYEYLYRHILSIILFLIVWVIMLVDRLYTVFTGEVNYWLLLGHIIALSEVGLIDFVCFGFTTDNLTRWKLSCRSSVFTGDSSETQPILSNDSVNYTGGSGTYYN
jgi:hypothetical protein